MSRFQSSFSPLPLSRQLSDLWRPAHHLDWITTQLGLKFWYKIPYQCQSFGEFICYSLEIFAQFYCSDSGKDIFSMRIEFCLVVNAELPSISFYLYWLSMRFKFIHIAFPQTMSFEVHGQWGLKCLFCKNCKTLVCRDNYYETIIVGCNILAPEKTHLSVSATHGSGAVLLIHGIAPTPSLHSCIHYCVARSSRRSSC